MWARLPIVLLLCFVIGCASQARVATKGDCILEDSGVVVTMHGASWHRLFVADSEPVMHGTHVSLSYVLNLDPDQMANQRNYGGLADHARLYVSFGRQFSTRRAQPADFVAEVRGEGLALTRPLNSDGQAFVEGTDLDAMLGGSGDIGIQLLDAQGEVLRRERISRNDLRQIDELVRRLSSQIRERLGDPARHCAPEEEIVVT